MCSHSCNRSKSGENANIADVKTKAVSGSDYCYSHKCAVESCKDSRFLYSNYCYKHYLLYDDDAQEEFGSDPVYSHELKISNVKLTSNSSYTIAEGTITNNSDQTVSS